MGLCACTRVRGHRITAVCAHTCVNTIIDVCMDTISQLCVHTYVWTPYHSCVWTLSQLCVDTASQLCVHAGVHIQQGSLPPGVYASDAGSWSCPVGSSGRPSPGLLSPLLDASEPRLTRVE